MAGLLTRFFLAMEVPFGPLGKNSVSRGARKGPSGPWVKIVCQGVLIPIKMYVSMLRGHPPGLCATRKEGQNLGKATLGTGIEQAFNRLWKTVSPA